MAAILAADAAFEALRAGLHDDVSLEIVTRQPGPCLPAGQGLIQQTLSRIVQGEVVSVDWR